MKNYTKGYKGAVQAHHILEQRIFKSKYNTNDMLSIVIPRDLHQEFTDAWRQALDYGSDYAELLKNPEELRKIITQVYENHPEILELALDYYDSLNLGDLK